MIFFVKKKNRTLDDFVKDLNWHAGEVFTEQDLNNHISRYEAFRRTTATAMRP
jgi:hypothetical protein